MTREQASAKVASGGAQTPIAVAWLVFSAGANGGARSASSRDPVPATRIARIASGSPFHRAARSAIVRTPRSRTSRWRPLLAGAKLRYRRYHATRHSYATWLLSDGADLRWVQRQLGHASIGQTA